MKRSLKILLIVCLGGIILWGLWIFWAAAVFSGAFDTKYTREELAENFKTNERHLQSFIATSKMP